MFGTGIPPVGLALLVPGFPQIAVNAAIGLALFVELFGYSSLVAAYWYRHQIDFNIAAKLLVITVPVAAVARAGSYYVPSNVLMAGFGVLLVVLAIVLYEAHEHGPSLIDRVAGTPEFSLLAILNTDYNPRTQVMTDTHDAEETPRAITWADRPPRPRKARTGRP